MQDAIIIGGGITGLTTAYLLQQKGLDVSLIEKNAKAGGPMQSYQKNGYLVERGPNSLLLPDPWVERLISELGLQDSMQEAQAYAQKRYIIKKGRPIEVPQSPGQAIVTRLFSLRAKLGFLAEPFRRRLSDTQAELETVASFVRRRMGSEFLDYAIDPFVSGVYAGDPEELILKHAFPLMHGFERDGGSIIKGALRYKKKRKREGTAYKKRSISFRNGLQELPDALARKLGNRLWLNSEAVAINRNDESWQITWKRDGENYEGFARKLIVCLPSYAIRNLAWPSEIKETILAAPKLPYPTVHSLALGFHQRQIDHLLDGFGMLAPRKEKRKTLGTLFSSSLFKNRAPEGHCLLTVMLGGRRHPELSVSAKSELIKVALDDIRPLLGIQGEPSFAELSAWPRAIPQYSIQFGPWSQTLRGLEEDCPGLRFGGHAIDGIALGDCIMSGKRLASM